MVRPDPMASGLELRERLERLVERVKLEQSQVETMEAAFEQDKVSSLFLRPETATGVFSYRAPENIRWEYESPDPIVMLINGEELITWYPDLQRAEAMTVRRYSEQVFKYLGAGGSLDTMLKYFWLTVSFPESSGEPYHLDLRPRYQRIAKRIQGLELWIDGESFLPIRLKYVEPNGDHTEYRFRDLRVNQKLPADRFELELPPDVVVKRAG